MNEAVVLSSEGEVLAGDRLGDYEVIVAGGDLPSSNVAFAFQRREEFAQWAEHSRLAEAYIGIQRVVSETAPFQHEDTSRFEEAQRAHVERINGLLRERADELGVEPESPEFDTRISEQRHPLEPSLFGSAWLYADPSWGHPWFYVPRGVPFPHLGWIGWNDVPSSARLYPRWVVGWDTILLCEHTWWGGRWLYLSSGFASFNSFKLSWFGFDNTASSAYLYP